MGLGLTLASAGLYANNLHLAASRQITTPTRRHPVFTDRTLFLAPNQQRQSTFCKCTYLLTSYRPGGGETICALADGSSTRGGCTSAVRTSLVAGQLQAASMPIA